MAPKRTKNGWWKQYPRLSSARFRADNSARSLRVSSGHSVSWDDDKLYITNKWADTCTPIGYTLNPPYNSISFNRGGISAEIAIMFEYPNGEQFWEHFPI